MVNTIIVISWMVSPCIHSSVYIFESGYISPGTSLSSLPKQRRGGHFVMFQLRIHALTALFWIQHHKPPPTSSLSLQNVNPFTPTLRLKCI